MVDLRLSGPVIAIADLLGAPEDGIRLISSILMGYPLALFHRYFLYGKNANLQHFYHMITGLALCYFNFESSAVHSIITVVVNYVMLYILKGTVASVVASYAFNTIYLVIGFTQTMDDEKYGIRWTTAQCVLVLKCIGLAFDIFDGHRKVESLSPEQKETARKDLPTPLQVGGFIFCYAGFLTGPQFSMRRYEDFVAGAYSDPKTGGLPKCIGPAVKRLLAGLAYTAVYQVSNLVLPNSFMLSNEFHDYSFPGRCAVILIWGKFHIYKYFGVWLLAEGTIIMCGMSYNGEDEKKEPLWDACRNIHIRKFEFALKMNDIIMAFNVNTNKWMAKYLYKRLKWMGNKDISQAATLFYLALWHGIHSGYFHNFFMEFIMMFAEKGLDNIYSKSTAVRNFTSQPVVAMVLVPVRKVLVVFNLSYALVSFCLFTYTRYFEVYFAVFCVGHIPYLVFPFIYPFLLSALRDGKRPQDRNGRSIHDVSDPTTPGDVPTTTSDDKIKSQ